MLHGDASCGKRPGVCEDVRRVRVPTQGQDSRMFQKEQLVRDAVIRALGNEPLLEGMRPGVGHAPEP